MTLSEWLTAHPKVTLSVQACRSPHYFGYYGVFWEASLKVGTRTIGKSQDSMPSNAINDLINTMRGNWIPQLTEYFPEGFDVVQ